MYLRIKSACEGSEVGEVNVEITAVDWRPDQSRPAGVQARPGEFTSILSAMGFSRAHWPQDSIQPP